MDLSNIISGIKKATNIVASVSKEITDIKIRERISEFQRIIASVQTALLSVQQEHQELLIKNHKTEKKMLEYKNWSKTKSQYELKEVSSGFFAYIVKQSGETVKPCHYLCANCYKDKKKSILQFHNKALSGNYFKCQECNNGIVIS